MASDWDKRNLQDKYTCLKKFARMPPSTKQSVGSLKSPTLPRGISTLPPSTGAGREGSTEFRIDPPSTNGNGLICSVGNDMNHVNVNGDGSHVEMNCVCSQCSPDIAFACLHKMQNLDQRFQKQDSKNICCGFLGLHSLKRHNPKLRNKRAQSLNQTTSNTPRGKKKSKHTLFASSSALCLALLETDLSDSNRARRNSIVIAVESSMLELVLCMRINQ
ncbi:hypothetical protein SADUNF_Sadunf10G0183000 [Salix dunnii]|uniref:Uncharacterized protein n=1 Tax=Salix dunnii TaxID=1413687 RepID=A0A835JV74_9ROSI|nr:hypothetical protein SADUNF_Sadunf10G0183000 [Salix dunnii]